MACSETVQQAAQGTPLGCISEVNINQSIGLHELVDSRMRPLGRRQLAPWAAQEMRMMSAMMA